MNLRPVLEVLVRFLPRPRVIYDREGKSPYLSRYYLRGRPTMPDGSEPFAPDGAPKREAIFPEGVAIYLHKFHRSDSDDALHNHPWVWSRSLVLAGGYSEERRVGNAVVRRDVRPVTWNRIDADDFHRVDLLEQDCWSLFFAGPKTSKSWGFWNRVTRVFLPWRDFIASVRGPRWDGGESVRS
jgi:hypothetical protein